MRRFNIYRLPSHQVALVTPLYASETFTSNSRTGYCPVVLAQTFLQREPIRRFQKDKMSRVAV